MKKRAIAALALTAALSFAGCATDTEGTEGGTYFVQFDMQRQNVFIDGEQIGASEFTSLSGKMRGRIAALEEEFSADLAGSDLSRVNAAAAGETVSVSGDTMEAFTLAESYASLTGGSFSPALFPLTELWKFSPAYEGHYNDPRPSPSADEIAAAKAVSDLSLFDADAGAKTITKAQSGAKLDFGGIAKGYMSDAALALLLGQYEGRQVDAIFSVMSNSILLGQKVNADGTRRNYTASVTNPRYDPEEPADAGLYIVELSDCALTTSADNYRFYVYDGRIYPHIIDGSTGEPANNGVISITIVMPLSVPHAGAFSDALSTAGFCMPLTDALAFYEEMSGIYGCTAAVITADFRYYVIGDAQVIGRKQFAQYANDNLGANNDVDAIREVFTRADPEDASDEVIPCEEELAYRGRMAAQSA